MFAQAEVSWCRHGGGAGLEVKFWGGDSERQREWGRNTEIHTVQYQGPYTVDTVDMDTSQATSDVCPLQHTYGSNISTELADYSPNVNISTGDPPKRVRGALPPPSPIAI